MKKIIAILFFLFFQFFAMAGNSFADSCYWEGNGDGGYWVDTDPDLGNWSSGVLPADGDDVYILDTSDSVPCRNVTYNMAEDYPELNSLAIDNNMTLDHNDLACPILAANHISVGLESGFGMINQEVGTTVVEYLNLGINSNVNKESGELVRGIGFYQLKGDAADVFVDVDYLNVGVNGYGEFNQFGGRVDADFVNIGAFEERGYGHYNMSGGELCIYNDLMIDGAADGNESIFTMNGGTIFKMPGEVKIGCQRSASFIQYDGYFRFEGAMYLGDQNSGTPSCGQYIMYGGVLDGMKDNDDEEGAGLVLGEWGGTGIFTQNGGVVRVDELTLARQNDPEEGGTSHAYYTMNAGKSGEPELYTGVSHVGDAGVGVFTQNA
ncbi:MAG TPA: hypothetical protein PKG81_04985, partial [Candidatus Omnitrophota bacterium]|nr:hypothetical protein [Candidatus Omnitrophota bacterium]